MWCGYPLGCNVSFQRCDNYVYFGDGLSNCKNALIIRYKLLSCYRISMENRKIRSLLSCIVVSLKSYSRSLTKECKHNLK